MPCDRHSTTPCIFYLFLFLFLVSFKLLVTYITLFSIFDLTRPSIRLMDADLFMVYGVRDCSLYDK